MKTALLSSLTSLMLLAGATSAASAADRFYMDPATVLPGETKTLAFSLENEQTYYGIQADIYIPEGLEYVLTDDGAVEASLSSRYSEFFDANIQEDGALRVLAFSFSNAAIEGNSGELIYVTVKAADDFAGGTLSITNISMTGEGFQAIDLPDYAVAISAEAHNVSYIPDFTIKTGETKTLGVVLENETAFTGFQTDLYLPEGLSLVAGSARLTARAHSSHVLQSATQPDGAIRFISFSINSALYTANDGALLEFDVTAAPDAPEHGTIELKNQLFTTEQVVEYELPNSVTSVTVETSYYTLSYLLDGEVYKTYSLAYGETITPEPAPEKEGYTFSGWSEIPETMPAHDVTVSGSFSVNSYSLTYIVDGETYKTYSLAYGEAITPEPEPEREGYTFSGWSEIPETMPAHDVTVTGSFAVNSYTLTYLLDGEVYKTYSLAYGEAITPEPAPEKEGYTFSGWGEIPATMPAHDVTISGSFSINTGYKLIYLVDGETYKILLSGKSFSLSRKN